MRERAPGGVETGRGVAQLISGDTKLKELYERAFGAMPDLTMAEGALGLWHVMYHTSAEFTEMRSADVSSNQQTGQHHLLHNTPFGDLRNWDNVGFHENASLPAGFDPAACF